MQQVFASPAYQAGLKKLDNEPFPLTPEQAARERPRRVC